MSPLLALTIDNSMLVLVIAAIAGVGGVMIGTNTPLGKGCIGLGILLFVVSTMLKPTVAPVPPGPYPPVPGPYNPAPPQPAPMSFATGVVAAFNEDRGTKEDAAILSALFDQYASSLEYDGTVQQPRITTANSLGESFKRLQQYRHMGQATPMGTKYPRFESYVAAEMNRVGLTSGQLDQAKRTNAVYLLRTVGTALRGLQ